MNIIRHYRPEKVKPFEARWYVDKRLKCRFFATEAERERFIEQFSQQLARNGTDLLLGYDADRMRRWQEASRLAPDADPVEVMRFWIASRRPTLQQQPLAAAIDGFLAHLQRMDRSAAYQRHVATHLADFLAELGDRMVHTFTPQQIEEYVYSKHYAAITKRHYKRSLGAAFQWWMEQNWCLDNPAKRVRSPKILTREPGVLTVAQARALFRANEKEDPEICGLLALGAFAGMRASAISRVAYNEIDFAQRGILTPAEKTKTGRRHWIEDLPENLWAWLEKTPPAAFAMDHRHFLHRRSQALKRAGLLVEADDIGRENEKRESKGLPPMGDIKPICPPKNALRHSFVTYHVALHRNPGKTALIVSHRNQEILYQHYLGIATRKDAAEYFKILPQKRSGKY